MFDALQCNAMAGGLLEKSDLVKELMPLQESWLAFLDKQKRKRDEAKKQQQKEREREHQQQQMPEGGMPFRMLLPRFLFRCFSFNSSIDSCSLMFVFSAFGSAADIFGEQGLPSMFPGSSACSVVSLALQFIVCLRTRARSLLSLCPSFVIAFRISSVVI